MRELPADSERAWYRTGYHQHDRRVLVLPDAVVPVVAEMGNAPFVKMGFNLYTAEFRDAAQGKIDEVLSGTAKGADVLKVMS